MLDPVITTAALGLALAGVAAIAGHLHGADSVEHANRAALDAAYEQGRQAERIAAGPRPPSFTIRPARSSLRAVEMTRLDLDRIEPMR